MFANISVMKFKTIEKRVLIADDVANGESIRSLRESRGKSLRWLARSLKISAPYLSDMEKGKRGFSEKWFKEALEILW